MNSPVIPTIKDIVTRKIRTPTQKDVEDYIGYSLTPAEQVSDKILSVMQAHLDGIYVFSARQNCDELVSDLIHAYFAAAKRSHAQAKAIEQLRDALGCMIKQFEGVPKEMSMGFDSPPEPASEADYAMFMEIYHANRTLAATNPEEIEI